MRLAKIDDGLPEQIPALEFLSREDVFHGEEFVDFLQHAIGTAVHEFHRADFHGGFGKVVGCAADNDAGAVGQIRPAKPARKLHRLTGDAQRAEPAGTVGSDDRFARVHAEAEVERLLPDRQTFAVHIVEPLGKRQRGFARGAGVPGVGQRRAEDDAHTLPVALVEEAAALDQKVRGVAAKGISERHIVRRGQRGFENVVVEDFADDDRDLAALPLEIERLGGIEQRQKRTLGDAVADHLREHALPAASLAARVKKRTQKPAGHGGDGSERGEEDAVQIKHPHGGQHLEQRPGGDDAFERKARNVDRRPRNPEGE